MPTPETTEDEDFDKWCKKSSEKLIQRARDALGSICMEEIVIALHRRFAYRHEWKAFKAQLVASEKEPISTKDTP